MRQITKSELGQVLQQHKLWLTSGYREGVRACLGGADLQGAYLGGANLLGAYLREADLQGTGYVR
jgi:uncharacterized protein YjbI with pentapeptide repeats